MRATGTARKSSTDLDERVDHASVELAVAVLARLFLLAEWVTIYIIAWLLRKVVTILHVDG